MKKHRTREFIFAIVLTLVNTSVLAAGIDVNPDLRASFSCKKAKSIVEQLVCSDRNLANLDRRMGDVYSAVRSVLVGDEMKSVLKTQLAWLAENNRSCDISPDGSYSMSSVECLIKRYQQRTGKLQVILSRGNVIRELGGAEPWAENFERYGMSENRVSLLRGCVGEELEGFVNSCCAPGTETIEESSAAMTTYIINGKRYLLYNGAYNQRFNRPRYADCNLEVDEKGEPVGCPDNRTFASCAALFSETEPGSGEFVFVNHRWAFPVTLEELLLGKLKDQKLDRKFGNELYFKLHAGKLFTLSGSKGEATHYRWDAGKKTYIKYVPDAAVMQ